MKQIKPRFTQLAKNLRANQTDAEKILWKYLKSKQLSNTKFRRQQPIGDYIVDFVSFDQKLIIELDGGQHAEDKSGDKERDNWFSKEGYKVLRFWNNDVLRNNEGVLETIMGKISPSVQTGKIVYKTNRGHGLHFTARRRFYAVESDKPNGHKDSTC